MGYSLVELVVSIAWWIVVIKLVAYIMKKIL
jgi:hypothetical protein